MMFRVKVRCFYLLWTVMTLGLGLPCLLLLPSRAASLAVARLWNRASLALLAHVVGIRVCLSGPMPTGAAVIASQHQSAIETFALWLALDNPAFILKKQLLAIPFFGWFLARLQPLAIDRSAGASAAAQIAQQGKTQLAAGRKLVIFPEGTRRLPAAPPAYKSGGLWALYQLGYPVVPVALDTGYFWPKKGMQKAGQAQIRFLPPLQGEMDKAQLMDELVKRLGGAII